MAGTRKYVAAFAALVVAVANAQTGGTTVTPSASAAPATASASMMGATKTPTVMIPSMSISMMPAASVTSSMEPAPSMSSSMVPAPSMSSSMVPAASTSTRPIFIPPLPSTSSSSTPSMVPVSSMSSSTTPSMPPKPSASSTNSMVPSPSVTVTPSVVPPTPSSTKSVAPTPTSSTSMAPTPSSSKSMAPSPSSSVSITPTVSVTATPSSTITATPTPSLTMGASPSATSTTSATPSITPSISVSSSPAPSIFVPSVTPAIPTPTVEAGTLVENTTEITGVTTSPAPASSPVCFPASATVDVRGVGQKRMDALAVGDEVAVGGGKYSSVFLFTHALSGTNHEFVRLIMDGGRSITLTSGHYLYVSGALRAAGTARVGDALELADGTTAAILEVARIRDTGLYNPQTVHGDILVNGVLASTYTTAVEASFAHAALAPLRAIFARLGLSTTLFNSGADKVAGYVPSGPNMLQL